MKAFKKLAMLCLSLSLAVGVCGVATGCDLNSLLAAPSASSTAGESSTGDNSSSKNDASSSNSSSSSNDNHSSSSSNDNNSSSTVSEKSYTFKVVNDKNKAVLGAKVVVKKDGATVKELLTDSTGAVTANLLPGCVVSLENLPIGYSYSGETTLSPLVTSLTFTLSKDYIDPKGGKGEDFNRYEIALPVSGDVEKNEGVYLVNITEADQEVFFSFDPSRTGTYRITSMTDLDAKYLGYAGEIATLFRIESNDADDISETDKNFTKTFEISARYFYTQADENLDGEFSEDEIYENESCRHVFALTLNDGATGSYLFKIEYISDYYAPDIEYVHLTKGPSTPLSKFTAPADKTLVAAPYNYYDDLYFNETDGYYHANSVDGPIVVMKITGEQTRLNKGNDFALIAGQDPVVFDFTTNVEYDEYGNIIRVEKTNYKTFITAQLPIYVDENGMYPLTKDLHTFLYNYVVLMHGGFKVILPTDIDTSVQVDNWDVTCMAPLYLYCAENEIPEAENIYIPDGTQAKPYIIEGLGAQGYALQGFGGTEHAEREWWKFTATKTGVLSITTENNSTEMTITNQTAKTQVTISDLGTVTMEVTQGDIIIFDITCSKEDGVEQIAYYLAIGALSGVMDGSATNPYVIEELGEQTVTLESVAGFFWGSKWFVFTVETSGSYTFYSETYPDGSYSIYTQASTASELLAHSGETQFTTGAGKKSYKYVTFELTAGTTYYIYVGSISAVEGETTTFTFNVELVEA